MSSVDYDVSFYPETEIEQAVLGLAAGILALIVAVYFTKEIMKVDTTTGPKNVEIERLRKMINEGAISFLNTEYKYLAGFVLVMAIAVGLILIEDGDANRGLYTAISMIVGAVLSGSAGYAGMLIATNANSRTTLACVNSITDGLKVSFASGAVMSNAVVGLGLVGLTVLFLIFEHLETATNTQIEWSYLSGFGFGASCIALFARVGGGVFTKAADVGADLVGKVEKGIPEDDPRNPAVVADNVGDNVGDVAGMGADLFESFVGAIIATGSLASGSDLATTFPDTTAGLGSFVALPFYIAGSGIVASLVGTILIRSTKLDNNASLKTLLWTIRKGIFSAMILSAAFSLVWCLVLFDSDTGLKLWGCTLIGLIAGEIIGMFTEYVTSYEEAPTRDISAASEYGAAPVIIKGLGVGMISVIVPTIALAIVLIACNEIGGNYGIALSSVGLLATLGVTLATDAYGPVADNAGGIAEMAGLDDSIRDRTDALDSLGNTTAATGKGFAIGSAVLTSVGLIVAFLNDSGLSAQTEKLSLADPAVLAGTLIGAMLPFLFGALTMLSVDRSARAIITEVRLQFAQCPYLMIRDGQTEEEYAADFTARMISDPSNPNDGKIEGTDGHFYPDSNRCVAIATSSAVQEMVLPGTMAVFAPVVVGYILGGPALAGMLIGSLTSGFMLALTMSNAGGAWDNAKKWVEKCASEGEPAGDSLTYTNYGTKKVSVAQKVAKATISQLLAEGEEVSAEDEEAVAALAERMAKLYKDKHDAVVIGDTVGDPFKDTSGPALNILIKLMSVVSLVLAPTVEADTFHEDTWWVGVVVLCVVSAAVYFLQTKFAEADLARHNSAVAAKKEADAKLASLGDVEEGGAAAESSEEVAAEEERPAEEAAAEETAEAGAEEAKEE